MQTGENNILNKGVCVCVCNENVVGRNATMLLDLTGGEKVWPDMLSIF